MKIAGALAAPSPGPATAIAPVLSARPTTGGVPADLKAAGKQLNGGVFAGTEPE
ncbi:hypothetical protein [Actinomadura yumaensis]|uniref:Uncharacterized protein n=1 Tax=Actinomadura yumaensis TaxID=111807 RepID=A0ABW2CRS0_9ACTN